MLTSDEISRLCQRLGLSPQTQAIIQNIRSSPPSRRVRSARGNVSVRYPSRKMGMVIQAESHRSELAGIYEMEHDQDTLEYYDQPPRIKLEYQAKNGRPVGVLHTPDYFVIRADRIGWEEWKTEDELVRLTEKMPHRYVRTESGQWDCPPGKRYASQFGLYYCVRSSAEINWVFQRNMIFLEDYLHDDHSAVNKETTHAILALVANAPGITLDKLLKQAEPIRSDDIYTLIAAELLYVDMRVAPLAKPDQVPVFISAEMARAYAVTIGIDPFADMSSLRAVAVVVGTIVIWDGRPWTIVNAGETTTTLLAEDKTLVDLPNATFEALIKQGKLTCSKDPLLKETREQVQELLKRASLEDLQEANRRYTIIQPVLAGRSLDDNTISKRTVRDWVARYRQAERNHGYGYVGLLPLRYQRGNRTGKLPEDTQALQVKFIEDNYETLKQKSMRAVYGELVQACEERSLIAPSYKTFTQAVKQRPRDEQIQKRQGRRAAYASKPFYWELELTTPRHGDRPFEIGHIDHTELDIELVCSRTGRKLGRPWVTFLVDAFSRRLLALYLTFDPPSYCSCMMVLRECVRRHGRLPQIIVVDGGREFGSTYFETLLACYECTKKTRPPAKPRFGSVCERLFGTSNTQFVHNLTGNTQIMIKVRQVTKAVAPKEQAIWTLDMLYKYLCEWAYEVYDVIEHPALGQSPREAFAAGLLQGGARPQRLIPYDENFLVLTLPTTLKGTALVNSNRGVKINYICYWSDAFRNPEVEHTQVQVRYDPFDAGVVYAFVNGRWVRCISEYYASFKGRSRREIELATQALRQQNRQHAQQFTLTALKLANFMTLVEAEEVLLEQRLRDAENRQVRTAIPSKQLESEVTSRVIDSVTLESRGAESASDKEAINAAETMEVYGEY